MKVELLFCINKGTDIIWQIRSYLNISVPFTGSVVSQSEEHFYSEANKEMTKMIRKVTVFADGTIRVHKII